MKKIVFLLASILILSAAPAPLMAADTTIAEDEFEKTYGTIKEKVELRPIDKKAIEKSQEFANTKNVPDPTLGREGAVKLMFGANIPRVYCRPMRVTDIELEPSETVSNAPFIGDTVNWQILPSSSGSGNSLTMHVMIKPSMPDITTNLIIHTDRRSYHIDLVSDKQKYMPYVAFNYPQQQQANAAWDSFLSGLLQQEKQKKAEEPYRLPHEAAPQPASEKGRVRVSHEEAALGSLDYNYTIKPITKNIPWLPAAVYNDGVKTYVQFPQTLCSSEAPILMLLRGNSREIVNYRIIGNTYVIDSLVERGVLLAGTGASAQKCLIIRDTNKMPGEQKTHMRAAAPKPSVNNAQKAESQDLPKQPELTSATSADVKEKTADPIIGILDGIDKILDPDGKNSKAIRAAADDQFTYEKYLKEKSQQKKQKEGK